MCNLNEWIVREAFLAYNRGDVAAMMDLVDPGLEWTYLDPGLEDPQPRICHGRGELEKALRRQADLGLKAELEEVIAAGNQVILVMRTPGVDEYRHRRADDRTYVLSHRSWLWSRLAWPRYGGRLFEGGSGTGRDVVVSR
jgi:ketosteroid isomerase-like protein